MTLEDSFEVDAPPERVWALLSDIPRVAGCIPGAEITEVVDASTYRAKVSVKVGPISVNYRATIVVESLDEADYIATLLVNGEELKGRGGMSARVTSRLEPTATGTRARLHTEAQISGIVASVGGRLIESVARKTVAAFAAKFATLL
ncbi:MAG TPA: SRPBCC family protein [Candidatus Baltobacteraceae bacterium]|nr:SRPBCC family protein [Candidatus Baltobacteraceae bacterium]